MNWQIKVENTPNPESLLFRLNQSFTDTTVSFENLVDCEASPLAQKLFGFPWTSAVVIGSDFISVTKQDWVDWDVLAAPLSEIIVEHFNLNLPLFVDITKFEDENDIHDDDSESVRKIKRILSSEIRPMVAMDGGDISFISYENQILTIHMKGACSSCPSKSATLKDGIEVRLKQSLPEIQSVVSI